MTSTAHSAGPVARLVAWVRGLFKELAKFGTVGLLSFAVDILVFNAMLAVTDNPFLAKTVSTVLAATNAFVLNRAWTFKHRERSSVRREYTLFFVLNAIGLGIALSCLFVSRNVLGFEGPLADNIAANGVGLVLGTTFRFFTYRRFVWTAPAEVETAAELDLVAEAVVEHPPQHAPSRETTPDRG
jgi:putative flippase GtrA